MKYTTKASEKSTVKITLKFDAEEFSVSDCPPHPSCPCFSTVTRDPKALQVPPEGEPKKVLSLLPAEGEGNYDLNS